MKKIIAILAALAVVSMAFAQTVSISNTVSTAPQVRIGGWYLNADGSTKLPPNNYGQWTFDGDRILREEIAGTGTTADGRATVWGRAQFDVKMRDTTQTGILNVKPQWQFAHGVSAAALIKPINGLEIHVGSSDNLNRSFGPGIAWKDFNGHVTLAGKEDGGFKSGIYAGFTGIEGLYIGGGIVTDWGENSAADGAKAEKSIIKKGAYGPFQFGASYDTDLFKVGAKYLGQFGGFNGAEGVNGVDNPNATDAKYTHHNIYAGFEFKGLADAKVGTTLGLAVDFDTKKASEKMVQRKYTMFAVSANAGMDFRNGITDKVAVTVAYQDFDGKKSKVLPFYIGNDLGYKVSDDASFNLHTSYAQAGLVKAMKSYDTEQGTLLADSIINQGYGAYASVLTMKPEFTFAMGAHSFNFGVETKVANAIKYNKKTANEWAFTSLHGLEATVTFPVSWTYNF